MRVGRFIIARRYNYVLAGLLQADQQAEHRQAALAAAETGDDPGECRESAPPIIEPPAEPRRLRLPVYPPIQRHDKALVEAHLDTMMRDWPPVLRQLAAGFLQLRPRNDGLIIARAKAHLPGLDTGILYNSRAAVLRRLAQHFGCLFALDALRDQRTALHALGDLADEMTHRPLYDEVLGIAAQAVGMRRAMSRIQSEHAVPAAEPEPPPEPAKRIVMRRGN